MIPSGSSGRTRLGRPKGSWASGLGGEDLCAVLPRLFSREVVKPAIAIICGVCMIICANGPDWAVAIGFLFIPIAMWALFSSWIRRG